MVAVRENVIVGIVIGLLFFGAGAILTALAIKQATNSALWDFVLWGGITMLISGIVTLALFISSQTYGRPFLWPALLISFGLCLIVFGLVWHLSERQNTAKPVAAEATGIIVNFEPTAPYVTNELSHSHILNTVRIGLKATGRPLSNCKLYVEKIAPEPPIPGGFPILLEGGGFILRPDDPEKLFDLVAHWDHVTKFRFNAPGGWWAETMNYIDDGPPRIIEIKFEATELQKTFLFRIWTDESKKLHLERL
jgi:hypothetical protein